MAYNEILAERVRDALAKTPRVTEKKMFGGVAFLVDKKMCVSVGKDRIMVRIDPADHAKLAKEEGASTMTMRGREYTGYIRVAEAALKTKRDLDRWIARAVAFNTVAKRAKKK